MCTSADHLWHRFEPNYLFLLGWRKRNGKRSSCFHVIHFFRFHCLSVPVRRINCFSNLERTIIFLYTYLSHLRGRQQCSPESHLLHSVFFLRNSFASAWSLINEQSKKSQLNKACPSFHGAMYRRL